MSSGDKTILLYTEKRSPRLAYIAAFLSEAIGHSIEITSDSEVFSKSESPRINYSGNSKHAGIWINPEGLLFETGVHRMDVRVKIENNRCILFPNDTSLGFDMLSAIFFLISRYEEYLDFIPDTYGRFPHTSSLAYQQGFLDIPVVDEWICEMEDLLAQQVPGFRSERRFRFLPSYDIDEPWSFLHKPSYLAMAAGIRDVVKGKISNYRLRLAVRAGKKPDPFASYQWLDLRHEERALEPVYFFLVAGQRSKLEKNIHPSHPAFRELVRAHVRRYEVGLHPSSVAEKEDILRNELQTLSEIVGEPVRSSRQHFIKFRLPDTFRRLERVGIRTDYSMGYGSCNGFRASTSLPFFWYDLLHERQSGLKLVPFCFMDANAFFEQRLTPSEALDKMKEYEALLRKMRGQLTMIWHNTFLGTAELFKGWREAYGQFLDSMA